MLERLDDATSCYSFSFVLEVQNAGVIAAVSRTIRVRVLNPWAWEHTSVNITSLSAREFSRRAWPFQRVKELLVKETTILHASAYNVPLALPWDGHPPFHQGNPVWPRLTDRRNRFFLSTRHIPARNVSVACRIRWRGDLVGFRIGLTTAPSLQCFRACALNFPDPHTFVAANCVVTPWEWIGAPPPALAFLPPPPTPFWWQNNIPLPGPTSDVCWARSIRGLAHYAEVYVRVRLDRDSLQVHAPGQSPQPPLSLRSTPGLGTDLRLARMPTSKAYLAIHFMPGDDIIHLKVAPEVISLGRAGRARPGAPFSFMLYCMVCDSGLETETLCALCGGPYCHNHGGTCTACSFIGCGVCIGAHSCVLEDAS